MQVRLNFEFAFSVHHFRASNIDGSVTSRKANLDIAVLRGEFPEEPLDTWVAQRGEVRPVSISLFFPTHSSSQVELPCTPPEGHPHPEVSWRRDGVSLNLTDKVSHQPPTWIKHSCLRSTRGSV